MDEDYKFDGFKYGFTYAVINKRDSTVASMAGKESGNLYISMGDDLINTLVRYRNKYGNEKHQELSEKINGTLEQNGYVTLDSLPKEFIEMLPESYKVLSNEFIKSYQNELDKIKRQPLLTISFNSNFEKDSKFLDLYDV